MSPAERAIKKFGGFEQLAEALGRHPISIRKWTYPRGKRGGTGGLIPTSIQGQVLAEAKKRGINLKPADLIGGAA
jgi:hypothetical protein